MIMRTREVRLEELIGRVVRSPAGRPVGRIDDFRAEPEGEEYLVREIVVGELGLIPKLVRVAQQLPVFRALGLARRYRQRPIPWHWLDLSDPERPRFHSSRQGEER
jgi:hypothetical protein